MGQISAVRRELSPSLIGVNWLRQFVVTLEAKSKVGYFSRFQDTSAEEPSFGFTFAFDDGISVGSVWEDSPAAAAKVPVGATITSINDKPVVWSTAGLNRLVDVMEDDRISITWEGGSATLVKEPVFESVSKRESRDTR